RLAHALVDHRARRNHRLAVFGFDVLADDPADQALVVQHHFTVDRAIGRLDEAVFVDATVARQTPDQADVRAFRRLNRANAAVVAVVHVADVEARALAPQTARTQRRQRALMRQLGQR